MDGYEWMWVDTCYIYKGSSPERPEVINSMDHWYQNLVVCYAYLYNLHGPPFPGKKNDRCVPSRIDGPSGSCADRIYRR